MSNPSLARHGLSILTGCAIKVDLKGIPQGAKFKAEEGAKRDKELPLPLTITSPAAFDQHCRLYIEISSDQFLLLDECSSV